MVSKFSCPATVSKGPVPASGSASSQHSGSQAAQPLQIGNQRISRLPISLEPLPQSSASVTAHLCQLLTGCNPEEEKRLETQPWSKAWIPHTKTHLQLLLASRFQEVDKTQCRQVSPDKSFPIELPRTPHASEQVKRVWWTAWEKITYPHRHCSLQYLITSIDHFAPLAAPLCMILV